MPKAYEKMRDKFIEEGLSLKAAEKKAARTYNAKRNPGSKPATLLHKGKKK